MAKGIVDAFEIVKVQTHNGDCAALPPPRQKLFHLFREEHAIRQIGKGVVACQMRNLFFITTSFRDVIQCHDVTAVGHWRICRCIRTSVATLDEECTGLAAT